MSDDREDAWTELHAAAPGWYVGTPVYHFERDFRGSRRAREMARCLREINAGRVPR